MNYPGSSCSRLENTLMLTFYMHNITCFCFFVFKFVFKFVFLFLFSHLSLNLILICRLVIGSCFGTVRSGLTTTPTRTLSFLKGNALICGRFLSLSFPCYFSAISLTWSPDILPSLRALFHSSWIVSASSLLAWSFFVTKHPILTCLCSLVSSI